MGTKLDYKWYNNKCVLEQCNSIWVQNTIDHDCNVATVLEQCNSIWVQNYFSRGTVPLPQF